MPKKIIIEKEENEDIDILFNIIMEEMKYPSQLRQDRDELMEKYNKEKILSPSGYTKFLQPWQKRECILEMVRIIRAYI